MPRGLDGPAELINIYQLRNKQIKVELATYNLEYQNILDTSAVTRNNECVLENWLINNHILPHSTILKENSK